MLDQFFRRRYYVYRYRATIVGRAIDDLAVHLHESGHQPRTICDYVRIVAHFASWLEQTHVRLDDVNETTCQNFVDEHLPACRCSGPTGGAGRNGRPALHHLIVVLRKNRQIPPKPEKPTGPIDRLLDAFRVHLLSTCGTTDGTSRTYVRRARVFLEAFGGGDVIDLTDVQPKNVLEYVSARVERYRPQTVKAVVVALRSFLRFAGVHGLCDPELARAVPTVPAWRLSDLPGSLRDDEVHALLGAFDGSTSAGLRDRAMALCLLRLGLRAGEVASLTLDDVDWRSGIVHIPTTKGRRVNRLPLPVDAGQALVTYLQDGRPPSKERCLFVRYTFPVGTPLTGKAVSSAIHRAFTRSGIDVPFRGSHILRHTAATQMIRSGATLKEIADVLGHRTIDTTAIYAKVDLPRLEAVALPWPEARR